jgi:tetratricopeptide (TPR) repeat protein
MLKKLAFLLIALPVLYVSACSNSKEAKTQSETNNLSERVQLSKTDNEIRYYQSRIKRDPNKHSTYIKLGDAYIQKARETGDTAYYSKAGEVFQKALELNPNNYTTVVYLGQVSSAKHEFQDALNHAKKAIELRPQDSHAYGIQGDAYIELGQYEDAKKAYETMFNLEPGLDSYSRISYIKELNGDVGRAIKAMKKGIEEGIRRNLPRENVAWAQYILGEIYFNAGDLKNAQEQYKTSIGTYGNYYYALSGLARVRAAEKNYKEAIELYNKAIGIVPLPVFVSFLGDVYKKTGNIEQAKKQYDLVEYIGLLSKINKVVYNRELALFYADHDLRLDEALELARRELEVRRDIYTYDTLAWTLYKNDRHEEALEASKESLILGTKDANLFFHIGMIYYKLGDMVKAKEYLKQALSTNPYFHVINSEVANNTLNEIEGKSSAARME